MSNIKYFKTQSGSSLIEVLIAVLVISTGLLGLAALQTKSLQSNNSSFTRSNVTHMAYDLGERMRLFETEALAGEFKAGSKFIRMVEWENNLTAIVGNNVTGTVTQDIANNNRFTISIRWLESRGKIQPSSNQQNNYETFSYVLEL